MTAHPVSTAPMAQTIDHTLLSPAASREDVLRMCKEAVEYGFKSVCVNPVWTELVHSTLKDTPVLTCTVVGFPLGATPTEVKVFEASGACMDGSDEVDMVIDIAAAQAGDRDRLFADISTVADVVHEFGGTLKVIVETGLLTDAQKVFAATVAAAAGADFVKTSTGFNGTGATVADVRLLRAAVGPDLGVKASGGIRTLADARAMLDAGATRIGASAGVAIVNEEQAAGH